MGLCHVSVELLTFKGATVSSRAGICTWPSINEFGAVGAGTEGIPPDPEPKTPPKQNRNCEASYETEKASNAAGTHPNNAILAASMAWHQFLQAHISGQRGRSAGGWRAWAGNTEHIGRSCRPFRKKDFAKHLPANNKYINEPTVELGLLRMYFASENKSTGNIRCGTNSKHIGGLAL